MSPRPKRETVAASDLVEIVADGMIAGPVVEGVNVPVVILDTSARPDVEQLVRIQGHLPPGDVKFQWGGVEGRPDDVVLVLDFVRPVEARIVLRFSIERQGVLVESALTARAMYLQAGKPGDRLKHDLLRPKMLVELPETGFRPKWNDLFIDRMTGVIARGSGLSRKRARVRAAEMIEELKKLTTFRMPRE